MDYFRSKVQATVSGIKKRVQHTPQQKAWCRCGKKNPLFSVNRAGLPNNWQTVGNSETGNWILATITL